MQIPATAEPTAYLSSLLFPNELANCTAATKTSTLTMGLGDGNIEWSNAGAARAYWIGFHYTTADGQTTNQVCVPLTTDLSLPVAWQWSGIKTAGATGGLHGLTAGEIIALLNSAVQNAFNLTAWHSATSQAADLMPLAGSSASGLFRLAQPAIDATTPYVPGNPNGTGTMNVTVQWGGAKATPAQLTQLFHDFTARSFRLMDVTEIQAYLSSNGPAGYANNKVLSVTDALGIQIAGPPGATTWQTQTVFRQPIAYPAAAEGWVLGAVTDRTITLPDMAASIEDVEKAISREVLSTHKTQIWDAVQKQVPHVTLADPDKAEQWTANQYETTVGTTTYQKLVSLSADVPTNRVTLRTAGSLQITNDGGLMMTTLLGFAPEQLGTPTEATETIVAANAAKIDKNRAVVFHCPSLGGGSYSTAGRRGGSALQMVPINVPLGAVQVWETSNPIRVECGISGSTLAELRCYLTTEDGDPIELLGDRWEAVLVLEY